MSVLLVKGAEPGVPKLERYKLPTMGIAVFLGVRGLPAVWEESSMKLRWLACWLLCLVLMTGCGNDNQNLPTDSQGNQLLIQSNKSQLNSSVRILPSDDTIQVTGLTENSITLTGALPPLKVGDIVARPEGENQFLRRIASIASAPGGGVTITTSPVGLNEVFDSADINVTTFMGPEFLRTLESEIPGVTFGEPTRALAKTEEVAAWQLPVNFNEALINDGNRGSVNLNGNISLQWRYRQNSTLASETWWFQRSTTSS